MHRYRFDRGRFPEHIARGHAEPESDSGAPLTSRHPAQIGIPEKKNRKSPLFRARITRDFKEY